MGVITSLLLDGEGQLRNMDPGFPRIDEHHHTEMTIHLHVDLVGTPSRPESSLEVHLGDRMSMMAMVKGLKGLHQVTVKGVLGITTRSLAPNAHMLPWMMCLLVMVMRVCDSRGHVWIMKVAAVLCNMEMLTVIGLGDLKQDMVAVGVLCPVRIHMGFIVAVVRVWAMVVEVLMLVMMLVVECTHQAMAVIICLVELMLLVALTPRCILVVVWVEVVVTWEVVVLDHTIEIWA